MATKMRPCGDGGRHRWVFVNNREYRTETSRGISIVLRGRYRCAMCEERKVGEPQYQHASRTDKEPQP